MIRGRWPAIALIASYGLIGLAFLASSPPGSAPDEYAHYLKAAAAGRGDLILDRDPPPLGGGARQEWMDTQDRLVTLPERLAPAPFLCWAQPYFLGTCDEANPSSSLPKEFSTYVGRYPPYSYVIPGLFMRFSADPVTSLYLGRLGTLLASLPFIAMAIFVLNDRRNPFSFLGLLGALTPMVLYVLSTLSSSSLEVAAAICFIACLCRVSRPDTTAPAWVWTATAASGASLALIRDLGPLWVALCLALVVGLTGFRRSLSIARTNRRRALVTGAAIGLSIVFALFWQLTQGATSPVSPVSGSSFVRAIQQLPYLGHQAIGVFGPLDTRLPWPAVALWTAILLVLVLLVAVSAQRREKAVFLLTVATVILLAVLADAIQSGSGFEAQARHLLPIAVAIPMLGGEIVARNWHKAGWASTLLPVLTLGAASALLIAWHTIGRRFAVGTGGPVIFLDRAQWLPAFGWLFWAVVMTCGAAGLFAGHAAFSRWRPDVERAAP